MRHKEHPLLPFGSPEEKQSLKSLTADTFYEFNLLRMPLCFPDRHKTGSQEIIHIEIKTAGGHGLWKVSPNVEFGAAGPFDDSVLMAFSRILSEMPKPLKNPIPLGPLRRLALIIGDSDGDETYAAIKNSFKRLTALLITSEFAFFSRNLERHLKGVEGTFHIINQVVFKNEDLGDGKRAEDNYVWLNEAVLGNINAGYACPIDSEFYFDLKTFIAKGLLKLFTESFYATGDKPSVRYKYSTLCRRIILKQRESLSLVKQQFEPALLELCRKGIITDFAIEKIPGVKRDWYVSVNKGPTWVDYYKRLGVKALPALAQGSNALEFDVAQTVGSDGSAAKQDLNLLRSQLLKIGLTHKTTKELIEKCGTAFIADAIEYYEIVSLKKKVTAGWLRNTLLKAEHEDIKKLIGQYKAETEKAERKKRDEQLEQLYIEAVGQAVEDALSKMTPDEKDAIKAEAKKHNKNIGIDIVDEANIGMKIQRLVLKNIGFPSFEKWVDRYYKG